MRSRMSSRNHPIQPLSPKHQPWFRMQAPNRSVASANMSRLPAESKFSGSPRQTVEQELVFRARIELRLAGRLEKLHDAVSHDRLVRKQQRELASRNPGEIVKKELKKSNA